VSTSYPVWGRRVLLVGSRQHEQDMRASVLRRHALTVDVAHDLAEALHLCDTEAYSWVLVDVRERLPGEVLDFCTRLQETYPAMHVAFLIGPPQYVTLDWPEQSVRAAAA
jgi:DNA-binding response OmpR family regulator